jgi:hypothetical protein
VVIDRNRNTKGIAMLTQWVVELEREKLSTTSFGLGNSPSVEEENSQSYCYYHPYDPAN